MCTKKPFVFGVAVGKEHFIGREKEKQQLAGNFRYGVNTILIAPRRWGKTSLVHRVAEEASSKETKIIHLDIFSCRSEYDFYNAFAAAILKQTSSKLEEWKQNAQDFVARLMPKVSISQEPMQEMTISLGITPKTHSPEEVLDLPEKIAKKQNCHIIICIDEFQQVGEFPDSLIVQKRMRSVWQHQKNVSYCLYGSKKHMMTSLFMKQSNPFYKFGSTFHLGIIPTEDWVPFLCQRFAQEGKAISEELATYICEKVENHPSYVQELAFNTLLSSREAEIKKENIDDALDDLIIANNDFFIEKTERLTAYQMNFLRAILDGIHSDFGTAAIREEYNLGAPSNIVRIKNALIEKEIIDIADKGIIIADPVLKSWLKRTI